MGLTCGGKYIGTKASEVMDKNLFDRMDDMLRVIRNRVWNKGGCDAIAEMDRKLHTCDQCGYESESLAAELRCPMCGKGLHGRRYLDDKPE